MTDRERAIRSCENKISQYEKRLSGADFHRGATMNSIELERIKIAALRAEEEREQGCGVVYRHRVLGGYKYVTCPTCKTEIKTQHPCEGDYPYCGNCGKVILDAEQPFCGWCGCKLDGGGQDARKGVAGER